MRRISKSTMERSANVRKVWSRWISDTLQPTTANAEPYSAPMTPAPTTIRDSGRDLRLNSRVNTESESKMTSLSMGMSGTKRGLEPAAMMIFSAFRVMASMGFLSTQACTELGPSRVAW